MSDSFLGHPGTRFGGTYRVKVYNSERELYWKYVPDSQRIQLATVDESEESPGLLFKWYIIPNNLKRPTAFTIRPAYNPDFTLGRDEEGNPKAEKVKSPSGWVIDNLHNRSYSTIKLDDDNNLEVLGCSDPTLLVDFELRKDKNRNQRFVFQFVEARRALYSPAFGYGSNIWDDQMKRRCPDNLYCCIARLDGWKWIISTRGYATIIPSPNDHVWGTVLLLHALDEKSLDGYEGTSYVKYNFPLHLDGVEANPGPVLTYVDKVSTPGSPGQPYINRLKMAMADGKAKGIPQEYFDTYWKPFVPSLFG